MPIYEYQCDNCEHKMEAIQKISDAPLKKCPECSKKTLRKLVSAAAFRLSGTGWYETDFKDKKPQSKENQNTEASKSSKNKDDKKTDKSTEKSGAKTDTAKKKASTTENTA